MVYLRFACLCLTWILCCIAPVSRETSTLCADEFPKPTNTEKDQTAQPMPASEAAGSFAAPEGFQIGVFAAEPDVQNPIAMTWDSRGRLWVAENFTYAAESNQSFDLGLRDRVLIFEDADHDGIAEKRTVFTDNVQMLTSVEVGHGGVWLMCPTQLLFLPDSDRDDKPDSKPIVVLDGFHVAKVSFHNYANGLRWGPDGWLYGRCGGSCPGRIGKPGTPDDQRTALEGGIWRDHQVTKHFEVLCHGTTNPWGHDWNQYGDGFFVNTVNGHLWQIIPGAHYVRPFTLDPNPHAYELIDMHADHWHFDTGSSWTKSREGAANSYGGGHAHSGASIYLGDNWPDKYRGNLLTLNFHGQRINQEILNRKGSGYLASHGKDMMVASDPFFRGIDLSYGPDGAVYVLDWSDTGECHERTGVHRSSGRIYRVSYSDQTTSKQTAPKPLVDDLRDRSIPQLTRLLSHKNEWYTKQVRLILAERVLAGEQIPEAVISGLKDLVAEGRTEHAVRALSVLYVTQAIDSAELALLALNHESEHIRTMALQFQSDAWPLDDIFGPTYLDQQSRALVLQDCDQNLSGLLQCAKVDSSPKVQLALASILQRLPLQQRGELASLVMSHPELRNDHNLPLMVWYGLMPLAEKHGDDLAKAAIASRWPKVQRLIVRRLAEQIDSHPAEIDFVLRKATNLDQTAQAAILAGLVDGLKGWGHAQEPVSWAAFSASIRKLQDAKQNAFLTDLSILFGDGRALDQVRKTVQDGSAEINLRRSALETLVATKHPDVAKICLPLLGDARLNIVAAKGVARSKDPKVAKALVKYYRRFRSPRRPEVIEILVSRPVFAKVLLDAIKQKKIPVSDLTPFDVRQIVSLGQSDLVSIVSELWGDVRQTSEARQQQIASLKSQLTTANLQKAAAGRGRLLFNKSCSKCHRMFGYGESIGPDLTGANRLNLDYLLENIVDPSAVVSKDYRMTILNLHSGLVLNGLVTATNQKTLTLQTQNELKTIALADIEERIQTTKSPMPDGLLDQLEADEVRDLIWYLMQPSQVEPAKDIGRVKQ